MGEEEGMKAGRLSPVGEHQKENRALTRGLSWVGGILQSERSLVLFPVRAHTCLGFGSGPGRRV